MAKISARGDSPRKTWTNSSGSRYVLTRRGRLLFRRQGDGFQVCVKYDTQEGGSQDAVLMTRIEDLMMKCGFKEAQ